MDVSRGRSGQPAGEQYEVLAVRYGTQQAADLFRGRTGSQDVIRISPDGAAPPPVPSFPTTSM
jgi:hypothetical protein